MDIRALPVRPIRAGAVVLAALAGALAPACGPAGPSEPVNELGWSAEPLLCGYRETTDEIGEMTRYQVLELSEPESLLATAECMDQGSGEPARVDPAASYFAVRMVGDRESAALVGVELLADQRVRLLLEQTVVGDGCASTADYRGELVLLVKGPADAEVPLIDVREVPLGC